MVTPLNFRSLLWENDRDYDAQNFRIFISHHYLPPHLKRKKSMTCCGAHPRCWHGIAHWVIISRQWERIQQRDSESPINTDSPRKEKCCDAFPGREITGPKNTQNHFFWNWHHFTRTSSSTHSNYLCLLTFGVVAAPGGPAQYSKFAPVTHPLKSMNRPAHIWTIFTENCAKNYRKYAICDPIFIWFSTNSLTMFTFHV